MPENPGCSKGGHARAAKLTKQQLSEIGRKGGTATFQKYGASHMAALGELGNESIMANTTAEWRRQRAIKAVQAREARKRRKKK